LDDREIEFQLAESVEAGNHFFCAVGDGLVVFLNCQSNAHYVPALLHSISGVAAIVRPDALVTFQVLAEPLSVRILAEAAANGSAPGELTEASTPASKDVRKAS
jgi:hypothetical protein